MRTQELHPRTAVINKVQKNKSKKARTDALNWLAKQFPQAFDNSRCIRPLKIGIMEDILEYATQAAVVGVSKSKLRQAVVLFTRRIDYLACLKAKEMRVNLLGESVAMVTEEEAENAALKIKKRVEKTVRNTQKTMQSRSNISSSLDSLKSHSSSTNTLDNHQTETYLPIYPLRNIPAAHHPQNTAATKAPVIIKHKSSKAFDPNAVAKLKEKLGLSLKSIEPKEAIE